MDSDDQYDPQQSHAIHSGLTFFPTYRHLLTLLLLCLLQAQGIYICLPLSKNANVSFLIGQIILLIIIFYSWSIVLDTTPGPMSQLFNEELLKKTIGQAFEQQHQTPQKKACTKCQMESLVKLYHCQHCHRCVYKNFFHSKWLNTCIAKQNFPQFSAFLVFLEIYLILLQIDNIICFVELRKHSQNTFGEFFMGSFQNSLVTSSLFIVSFLVLAVMSMIAGSYFMALRVKGTVNPISCCIEGCEGLKKKSSHDKILGRLRQSVRQSNFLAFNRYDSESEGSNRQIFRETDDLTAKELNVKSIIKSFMLKSISQSRQRQQEQCSIEDFQGQSLKTDFFGPGKVFKKKKEEMDKKKRMSRSTINPDSQNMTASKWKRYVQSTFDKDYDMKRQIELSSVLEKSNDQNDTPAELIEKRCMFEEKTNQQNGQETSGSKMKASNGGRRKLISKFSRTEADDQKENGPSQNSKKIRFIKKSQLGGLAQICEKQQKLEDA